MSGMPGRLELVETQDRSDMAHVVRDPDRDRGAGLLLPARLVREEFKRPRVYPRAVMIEPTVYDTRSGRTVRLRDGRPLRRRIGEDSMHDSLFEAQRRLERDHGDVCGVSLRYTRGTVADDRNAALQGTGMRYGGREVVDRNRSAYAVEPAERLLERYQRGEWRAEE